ncbi:DUF3097 domain-containing protein [Paenarthrobacter aurescens]|uniref:DUF3097 domain-containing protein n=1 Tax=Paenarthrobacter aurescens TaxID=43663 RepID=A0A4Y3NCA7_PAEAU|nr:DUF3097 domain-containing protein [Paenarthrobacter aurescens]UKA51931.1 DUF3097 domain-containing protein [Arthrobacter sp. FW305-123]MDO6143682.1 DUF3097 domain-containing protein [Paenarthrobacter aurescens]MDO6147530.1 DUF3097 domain-containing protein [Paenarthrobacter aurescens]MDO6158773.1 DUF3097 domain-containing protein [Paenarthrobacter aurescens]MDO6162757.1 DUF3097 domain-containing protein [Paenarthrobacter aurescens]
MALNNWGPQDLSAPAKKQLPEVAVQRGMVLEDVQSGWVGEVTRVEKSGGMHVVSLEDRRGKTKSFQLGFGFLLEGQAIRLMPPAPRAATSAVPAGRTASGSVKVQGQRAQVAKASRIWVEGKHDAELVEKVWGDDLRVEGIVVEPLHGVDDLKSAIADFNPGPGRRLGILVDHLVPGSKESRIAADAMTVPGAAGNVLIVGHPYVDVWQAIRPKVLGIDAWPAVPRGIDWKTGILSAFGWPHETAEDIGLGWQRLLGAVRTYADLEASLLGRVEEVIDFLTVP